MSLDSKVTVVLADDHPQILEKLTEVLSSEFHILATASNGALAVKAIAEHEPDVAVLDISMPVMSGINAAREIQRLQLRTKVVFLSAFLDPDSVQAAKTLGAGYVWKVHMRSSLRAAIIEVLAVSPLLTLSTLEVETARGFPKSRRCEPGLFRSAKLSSKSTSVPSPPHASDLNSRFLEGLTPRDVKVVLAAATERRYLANSVIVNQGEPARHMFLLKDGRVRLFYSTDKGHKTLVVWLTPGKIFGGGAFLLKPSLHLVSTEAQEDSRVLVWDRATLQRLTARYPRLLQNALLLASEYLAWHLNDHLALTCHTARQRLAHLLISLSHVIGQKVPGGIEVNATNEELANASNISAFNVCRLLSKWQRSQDVEKRRGKILIRSPERLADAVHSPSSSRVRLYE